MSTITLAPTAIVTTTPVVDFDQLYRAYASEITDYARALIQDAPIEADDIMQDTFVKALEAGCIPALHTAEGWLRHIVFDLVKAAREKHDEQHTEHEIIRMRCQRKRSRRVA